MAETWIRPRRYTREDVEAMPKGQSIDLFLAQQELLFSLLDRVEVLERQVGMNSRNSSRPPSSDGPGRKPSPPPSRRKRPRGARPGHEPHPRELAPPERVSRTWNHKPTHCARCRGELRGDDPNPRRHQVWEIPPVAPVIVEHRLHRLSCRRCGHTTTAPWPDGVPPSSFGPGALATIAYLGGVLHASQRAIQAMMEHMFGIPLCLGSVSACEAQVSAAVAEPVEAAHRHAQREAVAHADETGWPLGNRRKGWLWVIATAAVVAFRLQARRGKDAARALLGTFAGVLNTDRWAAYNVFGGLRQLCWAHLKRDFLAIQEGGREAGEIGRDLLRDVRRMFHWRHRVRDGTMSREEFQAKMRPLRRKIESLLERGAKCGEKQAAGKCAEILKLRRWLWTFVDYEGVEPTNNVAERAIRPAVLWRKGSFGVQSEGGRLFVERILTVYATCQLQHRNVLDFLREACIAHGCRQPAPSLLPTASHLTVPR